ncbi:hypothetical protein AB0D94_37175 [Streptomyces sp. NPDC048255]|uniref:hypothetical protein n=1 Tax=Streptomyces sp. NPDC048255 TaxID=3154713 RepID=UPI0033F501EC
MTLQEHGGTPAPAPEQNPVPARRLRSRGRVGAAGALTAAGLLYGVAKGIGTVLGEQVMTWALANLPLGLTGPVTEWIVSHL